MKCQHRQVQHRQVQMFRIVLFPGAEGLQKTPEESNSRARILSGFRRHVFLWAQKLKNY